MQTLEVDAVNPNDKVRAIRTIVLAFADDPAARWMYPDLADYLEYFPEFVNAFGGRAFGMGGADQAEDFRGAALWLPPGVHPDDDGVVALISRSIPERDQSAMFSLFEQMAQYHPQEPHWHLPLIGVEPWEQGRGYGSALLHHGLMRCDAEGVPAYLESSNVRNIPLYERHGFEVLGTIQAEGSPPITPMLRRPQ
jgi:ribosomal protein S18 acetylase RimI-like enzyme